MRTDTRHLVVVCANPSLGSGRATLARCELARSVLGSTSVRIANLFALPTHSVTEIAQVGAGEEGWLAARAGLQVALEGADLLLLAYGTTEPLGSARGHHRRQIAWLSQRTLLPSSHTLQVGDGPRHPSRWQRWTARAHPGLDFRTALAMSIRSAGSVDD